MRMEPSEDCWASRTAKQDLNCMTPLEELHGRRKQGSVTRDIDSWPEISLTLSRFGFLQHPILHRDHDPIALFGASYPNSGDQKDFYFLAICLMYTTREFMTSGENFQPKAGILFRPLLIIAASSASDCFCTSSDRRSLAFRALPVCVLPLPSGPWHGEQSVLKSLAASLWARVPAGSTRIVKLIRNAVGANRTNIFCI